MYGLLLENLAEYVKTVYGDEKWDEIRRQVGIVSPSFGVHDDYDENLLMKLASVAQHVSYLLIKFISFLQVIFFKVKVKLFCNEDFNFVQTQSLLIYLIIKTVGIPKE